MNESQIKDAAKAKILNMTEEEKAKITEDKSMDLRSLPNYNPNKGLMGLGSLTKDQKRKFYKNIKEDIERRTPGGLNTLVEESPILSELNIEREELKRLEKNPFKAKMLKDILYTVLSNLGIVGIVAMNNVGVDLSIGVPILGVLSGLFSLSFANHLLKYFNTKKLQKYYNSEEFQQKQIDVEVYRQLMEEKKGRSL